MYITFAAEEISEDRKSSAPEDQIGEQQFCFFNSIFFNFNNQFCDVSKVLMIHRRI
jgi:hypothetical protein